MAKELIRAENKHRDDGKLGGRPNPPSETPSETNKNTNTKEKNEGVSEPHTRALPTESQVVTVAKSVMMVPEHYARWWYREMVGRGWANTDGSTIDGSNWRPTLKAWYKRATPAELAEAKEIADKAPKTRTTKAEDWTLCLERCANCNGNGCKRGFKVPPDKNPMRSTPPEECPSFTALAKEGAA